MGIALIVTTSSQVALLLILSDLRGKIEPDKATAHCVPKTSKLATGHRSGNWNYSLDQQGDLVGERKGNDRRQRTRFAEVDEVFQ